jgi:hypothetical protein
MIWDIYPCSGIFSIPDPGVNKALDAGSGSASLMIAKGRVPLHQIPDPS